MSWEEYLKGLEKVTGRLEKKKEEHPRPHPEEPPEESPLVSPTGPTNPEPPLESEPDPVPVDPMPTVPGWNEKGPEPAFPSPEEGPLYVGFSPPADPPPPWRGGGRTRPRKNRALQKKAGPKKVFTGEEKLLILDVWKRSNLPARDFAGLLDVSPHSLYAWRKKLEENGPEALFPAAPGPEPGSRVDSATRRAILVIKESQPDYGSERISNILYRGPGLGVSASAVNRVLKEDGYENVSSPVKPHPDKPRTFERAKPCQLWQSDIFSFVLKRQGQRVHLVGFLDDHSRFMTGFGLATRASTSFVLEVVRSAIGAYGPPEEMLTDQGTQYHTWRGKSGFTKEMEKRGIRQIVSRAHRPQTLGKIERFWGTLWQECVESAVFWDLEDARRRIAFFIDHYNFGRVHSGIGGLVPADRFFSASSEVRKTLEARVAKNALELAKHGTPRKTFYLTGRVGDIGISLHTEGEKVVMTTEDGKREEVDLRAGGKRSEGAGEGPVEPVSPAGPCPPAEEEPCLGPGESPLDGFLEDLQGLADEGEEVE